MRYELTTKIAYVHLATPHSVPGTTNPKYSVVCIIPANDPRVAEIQGILQAKVQEKWPTGAPPRLFMALKSGDETFPGDPNFAGTMILSASSKESVPTADANAVPTLPDIFYSGCTAKVYVNFYSYDTVNKGVSAGLNGVQFVADGPRMDGRPSPEQMFAPIEGAPVAPVAAAPVAAAPAVIPGMPQLLS